MGGSWQDWKRRENAAREKASAPNFSVKDNPFVEYAPQEVVAQARIQRNIDALRRDVQRREDPRSGALYAAIMDTRYNGGEQ